jgi:hypothetical protein
MSNILVVGKKQFMDVRKFAYYNWRMFFTVAIIVGLMTPYLGAYFYKFTGIAAYEFTEEIGKAIACFFGAPIAIVSTAVFSIGEFFTFLMDLGPSCIEIGLLWQFILIRGICVLFHFFLLGVQLSGYWLASYYESKFMIWSVKIMAFICAVEFHLIWNSGFGKAITTWVWKM